jgi:hypothetical protein
MSLQLPVYLRYEVAKQALARSVHRGRLMPQMCCRHAEIVMYEQISCFIM